jgi:DHA3 family macrolide efflux protein-like MFS transporter
MQGRVFGVQQLIMTTILPLGMLLFGPIADLVTVETLLVITSVLLAIPALWIFLSSGPDEAHSSLPLPELGWKGDHSQQPGD